MRRLQYAVFDGDSLLATFEDLNQAMIYMKAFCQEYYNDTFKLSISPVIGDYDLDILGKEEDNGQPN